MGLTKTVTLVGVSSVVLVAVAIAVAVTLNKHNDNAKFTTANKSVKTMCEATDYKDACAKSLSSANSDDPKELIKSGFKAAISDINEAVGKSQTLQDASKDSRTKDAYKLCKDLLETSINDFDRSGDKVGKFEASKMEEYVGDVKTWLSGAIDYQETCIDAFQNTTGDAGEKMKDLLKSSYELSSNSLAMVSDIKSIVSNLNIPGLHRRLFDYDYPPPGDPPPSEDPGSGASASQRRLLDYDYPSPSDRPPSEDPGWAASASHRRLFDYDYPPPGDPPPSEDPGWAASASHRRLFDYDYPSPSDRPPSEDPGWAASASHRRLFDYDYPSPSDRPPSEDPGWAASASHRRLLDYDYPSPSDRPPSEDPGWAASASHRRLLDYDYPSPSDRPPSEDPGWAASASHRRLFDYDYPSPSDRPPSEDPGWAASASHRRLLDYDYPSPSDRPPSEDPGWAAGASHRRLLDYDYPSPSDRPPSEDPGWAAGASHRRLLDYDYPSPSDRPPSEDPGWAAGASHRRLLDYDYPSPSDRPPSEDPGWAAGASHRRLLDYDYPSPSDRPPSEDPGWAAGASHRRLLDYDYPPPGDPPPSEDPGWAAGASHRRLLDYDYPPPGDPPPSEDPGWAAGASHRRLLDYDYPPPGDPPPSEDPGWAAGSHRRLFDAAYGPPNDHSLAEDPGQGAESTVRRVFGNDNEPPSNKGSPSRNTKHISKGHKVSNSKELPKWVGTRQRKLLQANPKPNTIVALDGSGQFKSINEALKTVPPNNVKAFVILVKAGIYNEYVDVPRNTNNIVMIGEGATKTKVTGNKNFIDGVGTFKTATFAVNGDGFMAKDMGFENSAGAAKHQAVALRVSGDRAIFFQCQMDGFQDTLYTHTYRQFYRDCTITGTIDFIFGDAAAVFQNCKMIVRKPMDNQGCMVTAQGRKDSRSTGGNILQNCQITAEPAFMQAKPPIMSYLGRPWKEFSRTIVMQSFIDSNIAPDGWSPWTGNFGQDTCYYAEYQNRGPGSDTSKRVAWKGIQKNLPPEVISQFTAGKFIQGDTWIPVAGIPYDSGMMKV